MAVTFNVNGTSVTIDAPAATPLLWVIREQVKLTGTSSVVVRDFVAPA